MDYLKEKIELSIAEGQLEAQRVFINFSPLQKVIVIFGLIAAIPGFIAIKAVVYHSSYASFKKAEVMAKPSFQNAQAPTIGPVTLIRNGDGSFGAAVQITNNNLSLSLEKFSATFIGFNANHQEIYRAPLEITLLPAQNKFVVITPIHSTQDITTATIDIPTTIPWQKRFSVPSVTIQPSSVTVSSQTNPLTFTAQGTVYNNSPYLLNKVEIAFLLRDINGKIIGVSQRSEFTVKPFERRAYVQIWPDMQSNAVAKVEVLPFTDTLDNTNISLPAGSEGAASLGR